MENTTLRKIAEDCFLLAANIRGGEDLGEEPSSDAQEDEAHRNWRIIELVTNLGERIVDTAGIPHDSVWVPDVILELLDADYVRSD